MKHQVTKPTYHHPYHLFLPISHIFLFLQIKNNSFIPNPEMLQISFILILCRQACIYQISVFIVPLFCLRVTFIFSVTHSTSSFIELFFIEKSKSYTKIHIMHIFYYSLANMLHFHFNLFNQLQIRRQPFHTIQFIF